MRRSRRTERRTTAETKKSGHTPPRPKRTAASHGGGHRPRCDLRHGIRNERRLPFALVTRGAGAGMLLEVLAEKRLGRKIQVVGDLLDAQARILEQRLGLQNHRLVDPLGGGLAAHVLDHRGEVLGG